VSGEVARERDRESRPFGVSCVGSWRTECLGLASGEGAIVRGRDSVEVPREVTAWTGRVTRVYRSLGTSGIEGRKPKRLVSRGASYDPAEELRKGIARRREPVG
jgi:hypothetical protein